MVGRSYRTALGTAFYDRSEELALLGRAIETHRLVVIYRPLNVGKSELARYLLSRLREARCQGQCSPPKR